MTLSYIIWCLSIWIKYMIIYHLTVYYQALCEYWQCQDSTQTESSRNIIGHICYNQIYYWSINGKSRLSKLRYVTLVSVQIEESRGPKHNRLVLSKALHPSSFHCCQPQDPSHVFVLPSLLALCARLCALPLVFVCPRKLKERATNQGVTTPAWELSFSNLSQIPGRATNPIEDPLTWTAYERF
jgi:hypothetical protein